MKKYIIPVILLSIIGGFFSVVLLIQHYNINSGFVAVFCGDSVNSLCREAASSGYSTFLNFPVPVYGLLYYFFILIVTIFFLYAGKDYQYTYSFIILPPAIAAVIVSIIFIFIMITTSLFCSLCLITHITNILLLTFILLFFKKIMKDEGFYISGLLDKYTNILNSVSHARVGLAVFIAFIIFFVFSVFSISKIVELRSAGKATYKTIKHYMARYERAKPEKLKLHDSMLVAGNEKADLTITVFSDFLCSYCYKFYRIEEYLLKKFKGRINFVYYNYPLDKQCNANVGRSLYANSCIASKAMFSAFRLGFLEEYMKEHFDNYKELKSDYSLEKALIILRDIGKDSVKEKFVSLINSKETSSMLQKDIKAAKSNKINATPTIFIANKRIGGVVPIQVFVQVISKELQKLENRKKKN